MTPVIARKWLWGLVALWLVGCAGQVAPSGERPEPVAMDATPYPTPTLVPLQTATPTPVPSPTPTPSPSPTPTCTETYGRVEVRTFSSQILGREVPYRVYVPPCYGMNDQTYPVLYVLHGYPYDETHWDRLGVDETANDGIRSGTYPPFLIVMPNCDPSPDGIFVNTSGGNHSVEGLIVNELMPQVERTYRVRATREGRAIGGISRGGVWSLEIGFRHPDLFGTVGAHSAALSVNYPHPLYDPFNLIADPAVRSLRIWLDAGDRDWARVGVERLHQALEEQGIPHEFTLGEGGHENAYWSQMMPAYLAFYTAGWGE